MLSPNTVNHLRAYLMGIFTHLKKNGMWLGENPVEATDRLPVDEAVPRTLPPSHVLPLIEHAPTPGWRLTIAVAAYTGMRRSEIARVFAGSWTDVDLDERVIMIRKSKRKKIRRVAIHPQLVDIIRAAREAHVSVPSAGALLGSNDIVLRALLRINKLREAAGLPLLATEGAVFHGLRGAWATQMVSCGASSDVTEYMGWGPRASSVMRVSYVQYPAEILRREIDKLTWPTG